MSAAVPTDAEIRSAAVAVAPEFTSTIATYATAPRLAWARQMAGWDTYGDDLLTTALGYALAHRMTADLRGSQGSTSAPIGGGAVAGALTGVSTGGMSMSFGASGVVGQVKAFSITDAELATTQYGLALIAMRETTSNGMAVPFAGQRAVW